MPRRKSASIRQAMPLQENRASLVHAVSPAAGGCEHVVSQRLLGDGLARAEQVRCGFPDLLWEPGGEPMGVSSGDYAVWAWRLNDEELPQRFRWSGWYPGCLGDRTCCRGDRSACGVEVLE